MRRTSTLPVTLMLLVIVSTCIAADHAAGLRELSQDQMATIVVGEGEPPNCFEVYGGLRCKPTFPYKTCLLEDGYCKVLFNHEAYRCGPGCPHTSCDGVEDYTKCTCLRSTGYPPQNGDCDVYCDALNGCGMFHDVYPRCGDMSP